MGNLQAIEKAIVSINDAAFQNLCDSFLFRQIKGYSAIGRQGSQSGKQKTIKGTPDSFYLLPDGKYLFIEYSTNVTLGLKKLKSDISSCLDEHKTGIKVQDIEQVILCTNFNLSPREVNELYSQVIDTNIRLQLHTLDSIALDIHLHHRDLANEYLNIPLDTQQVVSIERFINEYDKAGTRIATPLQNAFIPREREYISIKEASDRCDFVVITGAPGVGKTKLAIEVIKNLEKERTTFEAYCISYKSHSILSDLYQYLDSEKDYYLFVDDANRIYEFQQIVSFTKNIRRGKLKIVCTVRDYAYSDLTNGLIEVQFETVNIPKVTDHQIVEIIQAEPFLITNKDYHEPIIRIADGNPRLAIMSALLAKEKQNPNALTDASDLFDQYFKTFIRDNVNLNDSVNVKTLGLIAFFFVLPIRDKDVICPILSHFGLNYDNFIDAIDWLNKIEIVEIQYDYVKIPEQNLATFFFFKGFIQDEQLSFQTLLNNYFISNQHRFKESIIPANNTFGPGRVMDKLLPSLKYFLRANEQDQEVVEQLFKIFWFYLQSETLEYVYNRILQLPEQTNNHYETSYETNQFSVNTNKTLDQLFEFVRFHPTMKDALPLAFEFVRKKPDHAAELVYHIKRCLLFDRDDWQDDYARQFLFIEYLLKGIDENDLLKITIFYAVAAKFLRTVYDNTVGGRNHTIVIYYFQLPDNVIIRDFRKKIWNMLKEYFAQRPDQSLEVLNDYLSTGIHEPNVDLIKYDLPFILEIIDLEFDAMDIRHCLFVRKLLRQLKIYKIVLEEEEDLKSRFYSELFKSYEVLDWDRLKDKEVFNFSNHSEYERLKEEQVRSYFRLNEKVQIDKFYEDFLYLRSFATTNWNYNNVLAFVIDETFNLNEKLGFYFLELILKKGNPSGFIPYYVFQLNLRTDKNINQCWMLIQSHDFMCKSDWSMSFFINIPDELISIHQVDELMKVIQNEPRSVTLDFRNLEKYLSIRPSLFEEIISTVLEKNINHGARFWVSENFFEDYFDQLSSNLDLIKKLYIQQNQSRSHFDYRLSVLRRIMDSDPDFLIEYVQSLYSKENQEFRDDDKGFDFVWELDNAEELLDNVFNLVLSKEAYLGIGSHFLEVFFRNMQSGHIVRSEKYLLRQVSEFYNSKKRMNVIVHIVRTWRPSLFEEMLFRYLSLSTDLDLFAKISWRRSGGISHGDVIFGDVEANEWREILQIVEKSNLGIELIPIKKLINERIDNALSYAIMERKRRFLQRF